MNDLAQANEGYPEAAETIDDSALHVKSSEGKLLMGRANWRIVRSYRLLTPMLVMHQAIPGMCTHRSASLVSRKFKDK